MAPYQLNFEGIGPMQLRRSARGEARFIYREVFENLDYEKHGVAIGQGDVVVDAGANIGFFTLFAIQRGGANARIFSFEPIPETFAYLRKNTEARARLANCELKLFQAGLTHLGGPDSARFTYFPNLPGNSTTRPDEKEAEASHGRSLAGNPVRFLSALRRASGRRVPIFLPLAVLAYPLLALGFRGWLSKGFGQREDVRCPLMTLSDLIRDQELAKIDLLKVDTEGAELDVLNGIEQADWPKIRQVVVETFDADNRLKKILQKLEAAGFDQIESEKLNGVSELSKDPVYLVYARR